MVASGRHQQRDPGGPHSAAELRHLAGEPKALDDQCMWGYLSPDAFYIKEMVGGWATLGASSASSVGLTMNEKVTRCQVSFRSGFELVNSMCIRSHCKW